MAEAVLMTPGFDDQKVSISGGADQLIGEEELKSESPDFPSSSPTPRLVFRCSRFLSTWSVNMTDMHSKTAALEAWLRAHGGYLHSALSIAHTAVSGLHWRALSPVSPGTRLITVPHALTISYLNALVDDGFPVFRQQRHCFKIEAMGFFYLMAQYINRDISFWKPYLDLLPSPESDLTTPLWFREQDDLAWLEGTDVLHTAKGRMEVYEQYYASGVEVLKQAGIDTCPYTW